MHTVRLQIGGGQIFDSLEKGLMYFTSDNRYSAPIKAFESTSYPEEEGEHLYTSTVDEAFDYTIEFFVGAETGIDSANKKIADFNANLYVQAALPQEPQGDVPSYMPTQTKQFNVITLYNDVKGVKIVGYPNPLESAERFWMDSRGNVSDKVVVKLTIRVNKPSLCDFNL